MNAAPTVLKPLDAVTHSALRFIYRWQVSYISLLSVSESKLALFEYSDQRIAIFLFIKLSYTNIRHTLLQRNLKMYELPDPVSDMANSGEPFSVH